MFAYVGYHNGFVWPATALCRAHQTPDKIRQATEYMKAVNTTAFPADVHDPEIACSVCGEHEAMENVTK